MNSNRLKSLVLIIFITVGFVLHVNAQQRSGRQFLNRIQAQRVAFYTERMNMTPAEAEQFWPVYNEYLEKKNKLGREKRKLTRFYVMNASTMTENDIDVTINNYLKIQKAETDLLIEYNKSFRKILPASKVMKLYLAENEFKAWLLRKIRENSENLKNIP